MPSTYSHPPVNGYWSDGEPANEDEISKLYFPDPYDCEEYRTHASKPILPDPFTDPYGEPDPYDFYDSDPEYGRNLTPRHLSIDGRLSVGHLSVELFDTDHVSRGPSDDDFFFEEAIVWESLREKWERWEKLTAVPLLVYTIGELSISIENGRYYCEYASEPSRGVQDGCNLSDS